MAWTTARALARAVSFWPGRFSFWLNSDFCTELYWIASGESILNKTAYGHLGQRLQAIVAAAQSGKLDPVWIESEAADALQELRTLSDFAGQEGEDIDAALSLLRARLEPLCTTHNVELRWKTARLPSGILVSADHVLEIIRTLRGTLISALATPGVAIVQVSAHGESIRGYADICVRAVDHAGKPVLICPTQRDPTVTVRIDNTEVFKLPVQVDSPRN